MMGKTTFVQKWKKVNRAKQYDEIEPTSQLVQIQLDVGGTIYRSERCPDRGGVAKDQKTSNLAYQIQ